MLACRRFSILVVLLSCAAAGVAQQTTAASHPGAEDAADSGSHRIYLDVVAGPKGGAPTAGLTQQDFTVLDNKAAQKITSFHALEGSAAPVEVVIVIDAVNTSYTAIAYERQQIDRFFHANGEKLAYPTTMAIFTDSGTQMLNGYSKDGNLLSKSLDRYTVGLRAIRRSAGFYGASDRLEMSIRMLQQMATHEATLPGRKLVLWISPGWPILTGPNVEIGKKQQQGIFDAVVGLSTELRQARITLYSIDPLGTADVGMRTIYYRSFLKGVRKPSDTNFGHLALEVIATQTGGQVLNSSNDIAAQLRKALDDANAYYELSFDPAPGEPNEYHQIEVTVAKPGFVARTRTGYYSQP